MQFDIEESGVRQGFQTNFQHKLCNESVVSKLVSQIKTPTFNGTSIAILEKCRTQDSFDHIIFWFYLWYFNLLHQN